jgi:tripartite-type tricarboxylate transporter receptor subunit TctC
MSTNSSRQGFRRRQVTDALIAGMLAVGIMLAAPAAAQSDYPTKDITIIVPFAAGGPTDVVARIVGKRMSRRLGQLIVIENVVGSGGTTAGIRAMRSSPDGYTIMMGHMGTHAAAVALNPGLAYNPSDDFEPVGMVASLPVLILARKDFAANNLGEFVTYLQSHSADLKMAHAGVVSVAFATCQLFNSIVGATPTMVPFQGTGPAMHALVAGRVDYMCDQVVNVVPQVQANAIKAYAVATRNRNPMLPDIPTSAEAAMPGFQASAWNALFAPKFTPNAVIAELNAALVDALADEDTRKQLLALGCEIPDRAGQTPQALAVLVKTEIVRWKLIIKPVSSER